MHNGGSLPTFLRGLNSVFLNSPELTWFDHFFHHTHMVAQTRILVDASLKKACFDLNFSSSAKVISSLFSISHLSEVKVSSEHTEEKSGLCKFANEKVLCSGSVNSVSELSEHWLLDIFYILMFQSMPMGLTS